MPHIKVTGTVGSIVWDGKLIKIWEQYEFNGEIKHRLWSCWYDMPRTDFQEQDTVTISGDLSCKVGTWTPKDATEPKSIVEYHLNDCTTTSHTPSEKRTEVEAKGTELPIDPADAPF